MSATHDYGRNTAGTKIDRGFYAVDPSGHLVLLPPSAPLKASWRLATEGDIHAKQRAELARSAPVLDHDEIEIREVAIED